MGTQVGKSLAGACSGCRRHGERRMPAWGWRIPFLISLLLLALGVYVRARVSETPVFFNKHAQGARRSSCRLWKRMRRSPRNFLVVVGARLAENALGYLYPVLA